MGDNMLRRFTVENYRNFKEPITLDFTNKHDYQFNNYCVKNGLLSKMIIFGENGSGKSNLGLAIFDIVSVLTDNEVEPSTKDESCFLNADSSKRLATFEYEFLFGDLVVNYIYKKSKPAKIDSEELKINGEQVIKYTRHSHLVTFGAGEQTLNFENKPDHLSVIRFIYNNSKLADDDPLVQVMKFANSMLWFRSLQNRSYMGLCKGACNLAEYCIEKNKIGDFEKFLNKYAGIQVSLMGYRDPITQQCRLVDKHSKKSLDFLATASSGTTELLLFYYWSLQFERVSFLYIDEFDAFYHFELAKNLVKYVAEINDVQAIFTSHNTYLASNDILRPDCYLKLSHGKIRSFVDSTGRELREGHNLEKMLRNGEFDG